MKPRYLLSIISLLFSASALALPAPEPATEEEYIAWATAIWDRLDRQQGEINLSEAHVTLNVPESFYFLNAKDAETVLVDVWGNSPGQPVLGMLFPAESTPFDGDAWGVTIEYEEDGYVDDEGASKINYTELLAQMKDDTNEASREQVKQGYESIELIGWAAAPHYDADSHKLYWAKEYHFGDSPMNTLNYNVRVLGRHGVLVMNFIADIEQQPAVEKHLGDVLALTEFQRGERYSDFDPDVDTVAAYGLGALVAGKVMAKAGLLATILLLAKKFGGLLLVGLAAIGGGLFKRRK